MNRRCAVITSEHQQRMNIFEEIAIAMKIIEILAS